MSTPAATRRGLDTALDTRDTAATPRRPIATLEQWLPKLVLAPAFIVAAFFFYGLAAWIVAVSVTPSTGVVRWEWVGLSQYARLFADAGWWTSVRNMAHFLPIAIALPLVLGCGLAILLDQKIRAEGVLRLLYLYPLALSWIVAGTIWRWILAPDIGIESLLKKHGFPNAHFDWIVNADWSIYAIALVAVWHSTGFVMAMFIAGLRGIDDSIIKAARIDGASMPRVYWSVVLPALRPTVFSALLILLPAMIKTYDLVVVLTQGGPGQSSTLPAFYMFDRFFLRELMGQGAAAGSIILMTCIAIAVPYIVLEFRRERRES
jgi:glucose/mannose transport system permease protein